MDRTPPVVETTRLLHAAAAGDADAAASLMPLLYDELHRIAQQMMRGQGSGHTLQPTALVHEAWLRLQPREQGFASRKHFVRFAAKAMRSVLVDHARAAQADKRAGGRERITLAPELLGRVADPGDLLAIDELLGQLAVVDPELAAIVELRVFAGLEHGEAAESLGLSLRQVERGWRLARVWLLSRLEVRSDG